jgi:hypothetical protein
MDLQWEEKLHYLQVRSSTCIPRIIADYLGREHSRLYVTSLILHA